MSKLKQYQDTYLQESQRALQQMDKPKIGAGHPAAMLRMGHDEISKILPAFPDSIQPQPEPGAWGEPTPQEVFAGKQDKSPLEVLQKDLYTPQLQQEKEQQR